MSCNVITAIFLLISILAASNASSHNDYLLRENTTYSMVNGKYEVVLELAIVCDTEFSKAFQHNETKILTYWKALLWDVHLRFKMLQNVSLSFRVNSIINIQSKDEQNFLEKHRLHDGKLPASKSLSGFESWLFEQAMSNGFTNYDIAILASGSLFSDNVGGVANTKHVCNVDILGKTVDSVLTITLQNAHLPVALVHEIGHLLGAYHDMEDDYKKEECGPFNATEHQFLMAYTGSHKLREHFFSPCSQKSILKFLGTKQADCLRQIVGPTEPIIDTSLPCSQPEVSGSTISLADQCQLLANNVTAYVNEDENNCLEAKCRMNVGAGMFSTYRKFDPFEGSECKAGKLNGRCILGTCVPSGSHLVHVATSQCVGNEGTSYINDSAILYYCLNGKSVTPHELLWIKPVESGVVQLSMLFSNHSHNETHYKCLAVSELGDQLHFENCTANSSRLLWKMKNSEMNNILGINSTVEFVLVHALTKQCLTVDSISNRLELTKRCSVMDENQQWKLFGEDDMHKSLNCSVPPNFISISGSSKPNRSFNNLAFGVFFAFIFGYK